MDTQEYFYNWLDKCPVQWVYSTEDEDSVTYRFLLPDTNLEDDDD